MTLTGVIPRVSRDAWTYQTIQDRCSTTEPERQGPPQLAFAKPERQKLLVGVEPTIFRLEGGRDIHFATEATTPPPTPIQGGPTFNFDHA
jgi:hypothetical protein